CCGLCRQDSSRGEAGRPTGRAADQVRSRHQPDDCQGARPRSATDASRPRRRGDRMNNRRDFITLLGGAAVAWPLTARAQQPDRTIRQLGVLMGTAESDPNQKALVSVFTQALADTGWKEGTNIRIEQRWGEGDVALLRTKAAELARFKPDAIFAQGTPATTALRQAAPTTPIVFVNVTDPLGTGLVSSLAYPGGNITGFTNYELSMGGKWLEFLKEIAPSTNRVAAIHNPDNPIMSAQVRSVEMAGSKLGMQV